MTKRRGRLPDYDAIATVMKLRKKGMTFRKISEKMDKDLKNVYLWYKHGVGSYPH